MIPHDENHQLPHPRMDRRMVRDSPLYPRGCRHGMVGSGNREGQPHPLRSGRNRRGGFQGDAEGRPGGQRLRESGQA